MSIFAALLFASALAATPVPAPSVIVGQPALAFSLPAINEDAALRAVARPSVALSDYTGVGAGFPAQVVVIHFVQKAGADTQLEALNRLHKRYSNRGARFLAVVVDDSDLATLSGWVEALRLEYPVLRDQHKVVVGRYGLTRYPLTMIVDARGDIDALGVPGADLESSVEALITPFLEN